MSNYIKKYFQSDTWEQIVKNQLEQVDHCQSCSEEDKLRVLILDSSCIGKKDIDSNKLIVLCPSCAGEWLSNPDRDKDNFKPATPDVIEFLRQNKIDAKNMTQKKAIRKANSLLATKAPLSSKPCHKKSLKSM